MLSLMIFMANPLLPSKTNTKGFTAPENKNTYQTEDYMVLKHLDTQSGTIQKTPTDTKDITNKAYVDSVASTLTVKEVDGSPSVSPVSTIRFSNGTVTNDGGGQVTITAGGGTPGGSTTQVQYNNSGSFAGDAGFTYDGTALQIDGDNSNGLKLGTLSGWTRFRMSGTSGVAGVFNRGNTDGTFYFGESTDTGGFTFRGSGATEFETIPVFPGTYTGILNDSTSTQIADVAGGLITAVYF